MNAPALPFPVNEKALKHMSSRWGMTAFMGYKLPLALVAGLRVESVTPSDPSSQFHWMAIPKSLRSIYLQRKPWQLR